MAQVSGSALTAGTWNALGGATLQLPSGTAITSNAASVSLGGSGAKITGFTGLAANSGSFSLISGASFATAADLGNSGSLTVGPGSRLTVNGNFTQTAAGTFNEQIGGTPASNQFGQTTVTASATLAGAFNLALVNGFSPAVGQTFGVMSFGSESGGFTTFTGLGPDFSESLGPTSLDLLSTVQNPTDLAATSVSGPTAVTAGQSIKVAWQVS